MSSEESNAIKIKYNPDLTLKEVCEPIKDKGNEVSLVVTFEESGPVDNSFMGRISRVKNVFSEKGLECSGTEELYRKVVSEFVDTGVSRADIIEAYYEQEDYRNYTIQVHALKSAARIIGASKLSGLAAALEEAGNEENQEKIKNATPILLRMYRELVNDLLPCVETEGNLPKIDDDSLNDAITSLQEMAEAFDFDGIDAIMAELKKYSMPDHFREKYQKLKTLVAEVARDDILTLLQNN